MKKILMLLAFAGVASVASAQQTMTVTEYEVIQVQDKYQVITNPFWSNWFFSVGGGAQVLYGNNDHIGKFRDRVAPTFNVSVGKWVTPGFGLRLQYSGLQAKGFTTSETANYVVGGPREDGSYKQRWDYMNLHGDLMINLNALFGGYNPNRVYEIIPYIGAGWAHAYSRPHTNSATFNAGIINRFRLSNAVDLNLELSATGLEGKFDGEHGGRPDYDGILGATLGVTYYFPTRVLCRQVGINAQILSFPLRIGHIGILSGLHRTLVHIVQFLPPTLVVDGASCRDDMVYVRLHLVQLTVDLAAFGKPGEVYLSVGYVQGFHLSTLGEGRVYLLRIIYLVVEVDAGKSAET